MLKHYSILVHLKSSWNQNRLFLFFIWNITEVYWKIAHPINSQWSKSSPVLHYYYFFLVREAVSFRYIEKKRLPFFISTSIASYDEHSENMYAILTGLIPMANLDLPLAEYAKALSISLVHTTARDVLTRKVRCLDALLFLPQIYIFSPPLSFYFPGICAMCGKKVIDTKNYKQTSVWFILSCRCLAEKGMFMDDYVDSTTCWEWSFSFTKEFNLQCFMAKCCERSVLDYDCIYMKICQWYFSLT